MKKSKDSSEQESGLRGRFHFYTTPIGQIFIILWLALVGIVIRNGIFLSQTKDTPIHYIEIDGSDLLFTELPRQKGSPRKSVISTRQKTDVVVEISADKGKSHIVVSAGSKKFEREGNTRFDDVFLAKSRTLFIAEEASPEHDSAQLWRWTEQDGFKLMVKTTGFFMKLRESPNEDAVCAMNFDRNRDQSMKLVTLSLSDQKVKFTDIGLGNELCAVIDKSNVLISESHLGLIFKKEHDVYKLNLETGAKTRFLPNLGVFNAVAFNGSIWCLCEDQGLYSAVRLNATYDKVEERIDLSKYVDRPWPANSSQANAKP